MESDLFDGKDYSLGLPKRVTSRIQCNAMDEEGHRCDQPAVYEAAYFGDEKIEKAYWIVAHLCEYHGDLASKDWEANLPYAVWRAAKRKGTIRAKGAD